MSGHTRDAGIVTLGALPGFRGAIRRAVRLRNSLAVGLLLAMGVFRFGRMLWKGTTSLTAFLRSFQEAEDQARAGAADSQGVGGYA